MTSLNVSIVTIFARSPDEGRDLARDMRVRWALEEVGKSYDVHPVSFAAMKEAAHRAIHPFGQIPTFEDGDVCLFASAAMVMHMSVVTRAFSRLTRPRAHALSTGCSLRSARSSFDVIPKNALDFG
jgi:hypothetical protein